MGKRSGNPDRPSQLRRAAEGRSSEVTQGWQTDRALELLGHLERAAARSRSPLRASAAARRVEPVITSQVRAVPVATPIASSPVPATAAGAWHLQLSYVWLPEGSAPPAPQWVHSQEMVPAPVPKPKPSKSAAPVILRPSAQKHKGISEPKGSVGAWVPPTVEMEEIPVCSPYLDRVFWDKPIIAVDWHKTISFEDGGISARTRGVLKSLQQAGFELVVLSFAGNRERQREVISGAEALSRELYRPLASIIVTRQKSVTDAPAAASETGHRGPKAQIVKDVGALFFAEDQQRLISEAEALQTRRGSAHRCRCVQAGKTSTDSLVRLEGEVRRYLRGVASFEHIPSARVLSSLI